MSPRLVASEVEALRLRHGIECYSHLAKSGRRFDLELNILVAPRPGRARRAPGCSAPGALVSPRRYPGDAWLSVCFTREKRWL